MTEARTNVAQMSGAFTQQEREGFEAIKNEPITDDQIRETAKKNNLERFLGLNVLNAAGIFLLIIGAIALARFTYVRLTDLLKGILLFALGGVMLTAGEFLNRKKPNIFSLGISAGGIGILYAALATSYFGLHILGMYPAIIICVLITAGAFVLSTRYNAQTIAAFALIGGYLPMFSIGSDPAITYGAMVYFILLNLLALLISFHKKWRVSSFIGLFLNIGGTSYICANVFGANSVIEKVFTILFVLFTFLIYTAIPIISTYRTKANFKKPDIVLLAINTFCSSFMMYGVFYRFQLQDYDGLLAVAFAVIYILLGRLIEKKFTNEEIHTRALFYLTGLAFVILIVPLQFGRAWLSLGWLAEGVALATYGILNNEKRFKQVGFFVGGLCLGAFVLFDFSWSGQYLFDYKYFAITLGSLIILGAYMYKKMMSGQFIRIYKYFALINVWLYSMRLILVNIGEMMLNAYDGNTIYDIGYLIGAAAIVVTFFLAYFFTRIRLLSAFGTKILSIALYIIGILSLLSLNMTMSPLGYVNSLADAPSFGIMLVGTAILMILGLLSVLAVRDLMRIIVMERKIGVEWYPLVISGYFVIILTQNLVVHFNLSFASAAISIIYVLAALAWTIFGFIRRYAFMRRFGLGLAILSVVKLFLIDLASLTQGYQILSYFVLGMTLIAISFVYQYFNKQLELKEEILDNTEKDSGEDTEKDKRKNTESDSE